MSELSIAEDEDTERKRYREDYQSFRRGSPTGAVGEQPRKPIKTGTKLSQSQVSQLEVLPQIAFFICITSSLQIFLVHQCLA